MREIKIKFSNRTLYTLIAVAVLIVVAWSVYAVDTSQPWHSWNQIADIPAGFADGIDDVGTGSGLTDNSVLSRHIVDGEVATADIKNNDIRSEDILDGTITAADLAANSVGASEIAASAVGTSEIANGAVTNAKISCSCLYNIHHPATNTCFETYFETCKCDGGYYYLCTPDGWKAVGDWNCEEYGCGA